MRRSFVIFLAACSLVAVGLAASAQAGTHGNPANDRGLLDRPIEPSRYDYGRHCLHRAQRGTVALQHWLERNWRGVSWGIVRCEKLDTHNFSLHSEGRALDWHLDARVPAQRRAALNLIHLFLATDRRGNTTAFARRMGVQGLIFNCRAWWAGMDRMEPYSYCYGRKGNLLHHLDPTAAHRNHIHIELDWAGARRRTSFWRSPLARR